MKLAAVLFDLSHVSQSLIHATYLPGGLLCCQNSSRWTRCCQQSLGESVSLLCACLHAPTIRRTLSKTGLPHIWVAYGGKSYPAFAARLLVKTHVAVSVEMILIDDK